MFDPFDRAWASQNTERVVRSAFSLHQQICPQHQRTICEILRDVEIWSFQTDFYESNSAFFEEDEPLSMIRQTAHESVLAIRNELGAEDSTVISDDGWHLRSDGNRQNTVRVFEGQSYRLTIQ